MYAAIDDVHHRNRQRAGRGAADIAVERLRCGLRRGLGDGERDAEDGIGAEPGLVGRAVELDQAWSMATWSSASWSTRASKISPLTADTALPTPLPM